MNEKMRRQALYLEPSGRKIANIKNALKEIWGENWETTMSLAAEHPDLYPQRTIDKSNNLMQELFSLRAERRDILKKLKEEE